MADPKVHDGAFGKRPEPPSKLTEPEKEIWRATVASEAADFFRTDAQRSLLVDYCRHSATTDLYSEKIRVAEENIDKLYASREEGEKFDVEQAIVSSKIVDMLYNRRERESKAAADKATKLRLTNQSRYTPRASAQASKDSGKLTNKPWEIAN